jgi:MYXO-CTERM domain-containing protein
VTACSGTCTSTAETTCQVDCQTIQWESCQTTVREKCHTDCTDKGGAIFCDGQFVNAANLKDCAIDLSAQLSIDIDVSINVDTHVDTNGDGKTEEVGCAVRAPATPGSSVFWAVAGLFGVGLARRRRTPDTRHRGN